MDGASLRWVGDLNDQLCLMWDTCKSGGAGLIPNVGQITDVDLWQLNYLVSQPICGNGLSLHNNKPSGKILNKWVAVCLTLCGQVQGLILKRFLKRE